MPKQFFRLKQPISPLQAEVDRLIHRTLTQEFEGVGGRRLFGVPISQIVPEAVRNRDLENQTRRRQLGLGHSYGKIPILVVDLLDAKPICAILISNPIDSGIISSAEGILRNVGLPFVTVSESDYESKTRGLLEKCFRQPRPNSTIRAPMNYSEIHLAGAFRKWLHPLSEFCRPIFQVALSDVIGTMDSLSRGVLRDVFGKAHPKSKVEFDAIEAEPFGLQKQQLVLNEFCAKSSFDIVIVEESSSAISLVNRDWSTPKSPAWWPVLAVEVDGPDHTKPTQQFRDFLKDRISQEAFLPVLRIKLTATNKNLVRQAKAEIGIEDPTYLRPDIDFIRFMTARVRASYLEQAGKREDRDRWINLGKRIKELKDAGVSEKDAISSAVQEDLDGHAETDFEARVHESYDVEERNRFKDELRLQYEDRYGRKPNLAIQVAQSGELSGRLDQIVLPPMKAFCSLVGQTATTELQKEFGEIWLLKRSLAD